MRIRGDQLAGALGKNTAPLYWLAGDEVLLMREAADAVRRHWREAGFIEREIFHVDKGFDWKDFLYELDSTSLFAERKLLELRLYANKLDAPGREAVANFLERAPDDFRVLISGPKIDSSLLSTKWYKQLDKALVLVQIWPIDRSRLPDWLRRRLRAAGIEADESALEILTDRVEGNLLAASQEIEKLSLRIEGRAKPAQHGAETAQARNKSSAAVPLTGEDVLRLVADSSRHDVGKLVDAALAGEAARTQRVLAGLRAEGAFPLFVLAVLSRELWQLREILEQIDSGMELVRAMAAARVWHNRKAFVTRALNRLSQSEIGRMLAHCEVIDHAVKGLCPANPWDELSLLLLRLSGGQAATSVDFNSNRGAQAAH